MFWGSAFIESWSHPNDISTIVSVPSTCGSVPVTELMCKATDVGVLNLAGLRWDHCGHHIIRGSCGWAMIYREDLEVCFCAGNGCVDGPYYYHGLLGIALWTLACRLRCVKDECISITSRWWWNFCFPMPMTSLSFLEHWTLNIDYSSLNVLGLI